MQYQLNRKTWLIPLLLIVVALACSMPGISQPTTQAPPKIGEVDTVEEVKTADPTLPPQPTPTPQPLPPVLVEVAPPLGSDFPLQGALTLYFNQPMDKPSVELALTGQPALSGRFNWVDDATVIFEFDAPFLPDTILDINLSTSALASNGLFIQEPINLNYRTVSPLKITQLLPASGTVDVDPTSAIIAAFNQPVIPLGLDPGTFPGAFSIEPVAPGRGEWVNTSTYIFYPDQALVGGTEYTVYLNSDLKTSKGGPFGGREVFEISPYDWSFRTAMPRLVSISPGNAADVRLDSTFKVEFSQPMDVASTESNFTVNEPESGALSGEYGWDSDFTTLTFTPTNLLERETSYSMVLLGTSQARGGTLLGVDYVARVDTVPALRVASTQPINGGTKQQYSNLVLNFNGPVDIDNPLDYITFSPEVSNLSHWWGDFGNTLYIGGDFEPVSTYVVTVLDAFPDPWGAFIGKPYTFQFRTAPLEPAIFIAYGGTELTLTPDDAAITAQLTNIDMIGMRLGTLPFADLVNILSPGGYDIFQNYIPGDQKSWTYNVRLPGDQNYIQRLPVTRGGGDLAPGIYHLRLSAPELTYQPPPYLLVSSNVQLTFKLSTTSAFIWALDLRSNQPVKGVPVAVFDSFGNRIASGSTDAQGVFQSPIPTQPDLYSTYYAVMSEPGDEYFSLSLSNWSQGIEGYDFGFRIDFAAPSQVAYLYTDRPIYRPGQTVYFRGVVRHEHNGRYSLPDVGTVPITVYNRDYNPELSIELPLSSFGTLHGEYSIPEDAQPGTYQITSDSDVVSFRVAEYRVPEIDLTLSSQGELIAGEELSVLVDARYYFDAPAGNIPLTWRVYRTPLYFDLPGYQVGSDSYRWLDPPWRTSKSPLGAFISSGVGHTDQDGVLAIEFPTEPGLETPYRYTLEVTLTDESGLPVSARTDVAVHPSDFYLGVRPDTWVGRAGTEIAFEIQAVNWEKSSVGERDLLARFQKVSWVREDSSNPFGYPTFIPQYTPVSSADLRTASDGLARLVFVPPEAGTYQLDVTGGGAQTQVLVWVGGTGQAVWPNLPNNRLQITADKDDYLPGDTANIFIPNPFGGSAQALISIERDEVLRYDLLNLDINGYSYPLTLTDQDAPNVYVSVTLVGGDVDGMPDFRQGYLRLDVEPILQKLNVEISALHPAGDGVLVDQPHFEPRDEVDLIVRVTDMAGKPVQGEFSLSVVNTAALALADPNALDILPALYGEQPLGVRTGMSLAVFANRRTNIPGGLGGGGDEDQGMIIRQDFPDTAFWSADVVTDVNGEAEIRISLPDNLTTWEVDARGVTADTRVGQARVNLVATKDLLIRPVTPRFLVVGDHAQLAAIVHNNSDINLQVDVSLQGSGFTLDDPNTQFQSFSIPAGGHVRTEWWGLVETETPLDLIFSASGGGYQDAVRPADGKIPVLKFTAPQTFGTAGILDLEGQRLEVISLPRTFDPAGGTLQLSLAPSLAAAMTAGFDVLEHYPYECTEQTLSRFFPNLVTSRAIQDLGLDSPDLTSRLDRTLDEGIQNLTSGQNEDGGWSWWPRQQDANIPGRQGIQESDSYISAYVLFGLTQAQAVGVFVDEAVIQKGRNYLLATLPALEMLSSTWQLDRLAFQYFSLSQAGMGVSGTARDFFEVRDQLSPFAKAFLVSTLGTYDPSDSRIDTLVSDLEATAIHTGTGVHWEGKAVASNLDTPVFNTAAVVYVIAQYDPASFLLPEALRYLMSNRAADGSWGSTYETAWTLLALTEVMKGTGELAGDFGFAAAINGNPLIAGQAGGDTRLNPVSSSVPVNDLYPDAPNGLVIQRTGGPGRLYYAAHLNVIRPAVDVAPLNRGIEVNREYQTNVPSISGSLPTVGDLLLVRIALTLEHDTHHLILEDYIPAGAEILDTSLNTSQIGVNPCETEGEVCYSPAAPFAGGWGWWLFQDPMIYADHVAWAMDFIPAGTYELTYTLVLTHPGEYQVLPARAWQFYFPEVQGNSAGELFKIEE